MTAHTTIALLVRQERHLTEALRAGRTLQRTGASVSLFFLRGRPAGLPAEGLQPSEKKETNGINAYTDDPCAAGRWALACMTIEEMAQHIQKADVVIPF